MVKDERWKVTALTLHNVTTNFENGKRLYVCLNNFVTI